MLLTVAELRGHIASSLPDEQLLDLMEAAEADILGAAPLASVTLYLDGGYDLLVLPHAPGTITSVTEYADTSSALVLATDDYRVSGFLLKRLDTGTNPSTWWRGPVCVVSTAPDRLPERKRAQVALVRLELTAASGVSAESMGDYSVSYSGGFRGPSYAEQKAAILAPLMPAMAR